MSIKFDKPTLVTFTAPTCAGKTYIFDHLTLGKEPMCTRIISTTTRKPRQGEIEGVHYYFISEEQSKAMEAAGDFAELVVFRGVRYGVTKAEMAAKMNGELTPLVILEPNGVKQYEELCEQNGWDIFKVFVQVSEETRIGRLSGRTAMDIRNKVEKLMTGGPGAPIILPALMLTAIEEQLAIHTDRLTSIVGEERTWYDSNVWDAVVPGNDIEKAIMRILAGIERKKAEEHERTRNV